MTMISQASPVARLRIELIQRRTNSAEFQFTMMIERSKGACIFTGFEIKEAADPGLRSANVVRKRGPWSDAFHLLTVPLPQEPPQSKSHPSTFRIMQCFLQREPWLHSRSFPRFASPSGIHLRSPAGWPAPESETQFSGPMVSPGKCCLPCAIGGSFGRGRSSLTR